MGQDTAGQTRGVPVSTLWGFPPTVIRVPRLEQRPAVPRGQGQHERLTAALFLSTELTFLSIKSKKGASQVRRCTLSWAQVKKAGGHVPSRSARKHTRRVKAAGSSRDQRVHDAMVVAHQRLPDTYGFSPRCCYSCRRSFYGNYDYRRTRKMTPLGEVLHSVICKGCHKEQRFD